MRSNKAFQLIAFHLQLYSQPFTHSLSTAACSPWSFFDCGPFPNKKATPLAWVAPEVLDFV
jgi:hypothetical protein